MKNNKNKNLGQYFTPPYIVDFMIDLSHAGKRARILEPACGEGIFLKLFQQRGIDNITGYEVDDSLSKLVNVAIVNKSFVSEVFTEKYDLVIGNPPYIRWKNLTQGMKDELLSNDLWKKYFNSLCDYLCIFILKSVELLKDGGELIFITPEYWINTKHAESLRSYLSLNGYFTDIIHFNETPIFDNVASSIIIFRYIKSKDLNTAKPDIKITKYLSTKRLTSEKLLEIRDSKGTEDIKVFTRSQFKNHEQWALIEDNMLQKLKSYEDLCRPPASNPSIERYTTLGDIADIGNGMVSGLDRAFQIPQGQSLNPIEERATISVLKAKNMFPYSYESLTKYIFLKDLDLTEDEIKVQYPHFYQLLSPYCELLEKRYSYQRKINYWGWVFLRSYNLFSKAKEGIFIPCKERISHKNYVRFTYVSAGIFPTQDVTGIFLKPEIKESTHYVLALLNNERVFEWLRYKGVVKGNILEFSEKPLMSIPLRMINWDNPKEISLHNEITQLCKQYILDGDIQTLNQLKLKVAELF